MSAEGDAPEAGAPQKPKLPSGLDWDRMSRAIEIVEEWECDGSDSAFDLIVSLYEALCTSGASKVG